jgi:predicted acylesterase/phospholipase RssA
MTHINDRERAYVVFQGGGALGVAHFGAWQAIAKDFDIVGVAGTSSGSIVAALCAAGVDPDKTFDSFKQNLSKIMGKRGVLWSLLDIMYRALFGRDAYNDGVHFQKWLEQQFSESDIKKSNITFEELFQQRGVYLEVVACDLKDADNNLLIFSPENKKRWSVSRAVRASISLPGIFKTIRVGNQELVDGGFKLNFPIENLYKLAKKDDSVLIGVRFKKSSRYFNSSNVQHVFSRSYELVMSNSSPIRDEIKNYPKCKIIEIDDRGFNPLNFRLSDDQLLELREAGREAAEEQLEELQKKLQEVKANLYSQLPLDKSEAIYEAERWFIYQCIPASQKLCKDVLHQNSYELGLNTFEVEHFCWEVRNYLTRIRESLFHEDYNLLEDRLLKPSLSLATYLRVLDHIKEEVPSHINLEEEIKVRIDYLKEILTRQFGSN